MVHPAFVTLPAQMGETILVVDDEPDVVDLVRYHLHRAGFDVLVAFTGPAGLAAATESRPDAIVLDIMLPQMTGIEVCKALRKSNETAEIPILLLTAKAELSERIAGLELGVDDYITKPFSPRELVLRVQNLLRRLRTVQNSSLLTVDEFCLDKGNFGITIRGQAIGPDDHRIQVARRPGRAPREDTFQGDPFARCLGL